MFTATFQLIFFTPLPHRSTTDPYRLLGPSGDAGGVDTSSYLISVTFLGFHIPVESGFTWASSQNGNCSRTPKHGVFQIGNCSRAHQIVPERHHSGTVRGVPERQLFQNTQNRSRTVPFQNGTRPFWNTCRSGTPYTVPERGLPFSYEIRRREFLYNR